MFKKQRNTALTTSDLIILGFLMEHPMHGYQIIRELKKRQVRDWAGVSKPQVYYSLKKLEASGLIQGDNDDESSLGPERRVFSISHGASSAVAEALSSEKWAISRPVPPFSTWAMLAVHVEKPIVKQILEQRRMFLINEIDKEKKTLTNISGSSDLSVRVAKTLISLAIKNFELELSWLAEFEHAMYG
jgi:DNA-binding PadR family transcriptional regulator